MPGPVGKIAQPPGANKKYLKKWFVKYGMNAPGRGTGGRSRRPSLLLPGHCRSIACCGKKGNATSPRARKKTDIPEGGPHDRRQGRRCCAMCRSKGGKKGALPRQGRHGTQSPFPAPCTASIFSVHVMRYQCRNNDTGYGKAISYHSVLS